MKWRKTKREREKGSGERERERGDKMREDQERYKEEPPESHCKRRERENKRSGKRETAERNEREISKCANLLTIVWYVLAVRQDCRRRGWKSTSDPPRKRLTPIPVLIAQTCLPSPLRLRVHTAGVSGVERGGCTMGADKGWSEAGEGMRLSPQD